MLFCRLLRLNPYLSSAEDAQTLHAFIAWKGLSFRKQRHRAGDPLGVKHQTIANEVSSIRTWIAEILGVNLSKVDLVSKQMLKGLKRVSGAKKARLRLSQPMLIKCEEFDARYGPTSLEWMPVSYTHLTLPTKAEV